MTDAPPPPQDGPSPPPYGSSAAPPPPAHGQPSYGQPPPPPGYGQAPSGYGSPQGYGQMPPVQQPYGVSPGPPREALANFGKRAQSSLVDWLGPSIVASAIGIGNTPLRNILNLIVLAWALYQAYQAGTTGQSLGRKWAGTRLANIETGQNIGGGLAIGRYFLHILDGIPIFAGFWLAPNVSKNKQTFADMIVKSVVVKV